MKRDNLKRLTASAVAMAATLFAATGCGSQEASSDGKAEVVLNEVAHSVFYAPMYVAIEEGYFEEAGIDLTLVTGFGADKTMTAVLTGEADIGFMGCESSVYTYAGGTDDFCTVNSEGRQLFGFQRTHNRLFMGYAPRG